MRTPLSPLTVAAARGVLATVTASILAAQTNLRYRQRYAIGNRIIGTATFKFQTQGVQNLHLRSPISL